MTAHTQQHSTWLAARQADLTVEELWLHYYSICGNLTLFELDAYLHGMYALPQRERNLVALALNELIDELPPRPKAEFVDGPALD
jgi:hypothetical protein